MARANQDETLTALFRRPGFLLRHSHQISVAVFVEACAAYDVTPGQYGVLALLQAGPGIDQQTLARRIGLDASTTGGIVARLAERGLIHRRVGETDRRARVLALTDAGRRLFAAVGPAVAAAQRRLLAPFTAGEREQLLSLLERLVQAHGGVSRAAFAPPARRRKS
jgi:MarR family transcriptional regulator, lower aerobic nicotinate degradation pathway regulator